MTIAPLTAIDLEIAARLQAGHPLPHIVHVGWYRTAWTEADVARIAAYLAHQNRQRATVAECGTESGYKRHRRKHETVCDACREGRNTARREQRAAAS